MEKDKNLVHRYFLKLQLSLNILTNVPIDKNKIAITMENVQFLQ